MAIVNSAYSERISEEVNSDYSLFGNNEFNVLFESDSDFSLNDLFSSGFNVDAEFNVVGECDIGNLADSLKHCVSPNELDAYINPVPSQDLFFNHDNNRALMNNVRVHTVEENKRAESNCKPIPLSQSVGVGRPQKILKRPPKIVIVNALEEFYRPRYKSDYFTQNGKNRKPRYVADGVGNHFVTLRVPPNIRGKIRVDWLTIPTKSGHRYSMPYRFQQDNQLSNVQDVNPIYTNISTDGSGIVKLYLVLIKSKQDELKVLQPLKPFHPFQDVFGVSDKKTPEQMVQLMPKQLIQTYQLDKSQLAFTFCALGADGKSCIPEWDTTVYSTVITEIPSENSKQKMISCPNCAHSFQITLDGRVDDDNVQEIITNKRKQSRNVREMSMLTVKKQKSLQEDICVLD